MALFDQNDFTGRLLRLMPSRWFPAVAPRLTAILQAPALMFSLIYAMLVFTKAQQRVTTASGSFLDLAAADYFGPGGLPRFEYETDAEYSARIRSCLVAPRGTRAGLNILLTELVGANPARPAAQKFSIWQPNYGPDCGFLGSYARPQSGGGTIRLLGAPLHAGETQGFVTSNLSNYGEVTPAGSSAWGTLLRPCTTYVLATPVVGGYGIFAGYPGLGAFASPAAGGAAGLGTFAAPSTGGGLLAWVDVDAVPAAVTLQAICKQIEDWTPAGYQTLIGFATYIP